MNPVLDRPVPLGAMSETQRRRVAEHFRLVYLALGRLSPDRSCARPGREYQDLRQEGFVALIEAIRSHNPNRHGNFAPYALSRIRHAVSQYAHECHSAIRIPYITQRRRRKRLRNRSRDKGRPDPLPRVVNLKSDRHSPSQRVHRRLYAQSLDAPTESRTIGDLVRDRISNAASRAVRRMKLTPGATQGREKLIESCLNERWTIPDEGARTPIRQLARTLGCSLGRITHCEDRFRALMVEELWSDPVLGMLRGLARSRAAGFRHRIQNGELAGLQGAGRAPK